MRQSKLNSDQLGLVGSARFAMRQIANIVDYKDYFGAILSDLSDVMEHGTSDGKPYVEPPPEIGEGYRVATEADKNRRDREYWNPQGLLWLLASVGMHASNYTYRVPIDRIPTDEDAVGRPIVMVCDNTGGGWLPRTLLHVSKNIAQPFLVISGDGFTTWKQARFPYPGELD
jgi:hypothetical protein